MVVPCFNAARDIGTAVRSIIEQGYINLELIVIDGGSDDGTVEQLKAYEHTMAYWISEQDRGQTHALNKGFSRATGDIYGYLCADDVLMRGAIDTVVEAYNDDPDTNVFIGKCQRIFPDDTTYITEPGVNVLERIGYHNGIDQPACFWTAELHRACGEFNENFYHAMDWEWWNRLKHNGARPVILNQILLRTFLTSIEPPYPI